MTDFYIHLPNVILAYAVYLVGFISPGPNLLAVIGTSVSVNRTAGVSLAMGIAIGSLTWALITAAGLTALLTSVAGALTAIKIAGGLYLLWLAYKAFRSAANPQPLTVGEITTTVRSNSRYALQGYLVQMTNPKAALAWVAIMTVGLTPDSPIWVYVVMTIGTFLISAIIHILYAVAFSMRKVVALFSKIQRGFQTALGVFFAAAGLKLLYSAK